MFFALPKSKCVHAGETCKRSHVGDAKPVEFVEGFHKKCKFCFPSECMICFSKASISFPCPRGHFACESCTMNYIKYECDNPQWDGMVYCPCKASNRPLKKVPIRIQTYLLAKVKSLSVTSKTCCYERSDVDVIVQDILTTKCQACGGAFLDFTGCLALQCHCKAFMCALCMEGFSDSKQCHAHVLNDCKWNHGRNDYFMPVGMYAKIQRTRKSVLIWKQAYAILRHSRSLLYTLGVLSRVRAMHTLCPHISHLDMRYAFPPVPRVCARVSLFLFAVLWLCIISQWTFCDAHSFTSSTHSFSTHSGT